MAGAGWMSPSVAGSGGVAPTALGLRSLGALAGLNGVLAGAGPFPDGLMEVFVVVADLLGWTSIDAVVDLAAVGWGPVAGRGSFPPLGTASPCLAALLRLAGELLLGPYR